MEARAADGISSSSSRLFDGWVGHPAGGNWVSGSEGGQGIARGSEGSKGVLCTCSKAVTKATLYSNAPFLIQIQKLEEVLQQLPPFLPFHQQLSLFIHFLLLSNSSIQLGLCLMDQQQQEHQKRVQKRLELLECLNGILPKEEQTDLNLDRWLDAYNEDVHKCVDIIRDYVKNRKAMGIDRPDAFDDPLVFTQPNMQNYFGIFAQSRPRTDWVNAYDNGIVFVETGISDANKAAKAIRAGDFLRSFFFNAEYFLRLVLERERQTGKKSSVVCIFDMGRMSIIQYANPYTPINRIFEARVGIWMSYYSEFLSHVVIVNPPRLLSVLLKIMSILLPAKMLSRFQIAQCHSDVQKWISPCAIPTGFGGQKVVEGPLLPTGCNAPRELGDEDFLKDGMIWEQHGLAGTVQYENVIVGPGDSLVRELDAKAGQTLLYEWFANRNFEAHLETEQGDYLLPRFKMSTPLLAEEGAIPVCQSGRLRLVLKNMSRLMKMKLRVAIQLVES